MVDSHTYSLYITVINYYYIAGAAKFIICLKNNNGNNILISDANSYEQYIWQYWFNHQNYIIVNGHITLSIVSLDPNISFVTPSISAFENATSFYPKYLYQTSLYFVSNFQVSSHLSHLMTIKLWQTSICIQHNVHRHQVVTPRSYAGEFFF